MTIAEAVTEHEAWAADRASILEEESETGYLDVNGIQASDDAAVEGYIALAGLLAAPLAAIDSELDRWQAIADHPGSSGAAKTVAHASVVAIKRLRSRIEA